VYAPYNNALGLILPYFHTYRIAKHMLLSALALWSALRPVNYVSYIIDLPYDVLAEKRVRRWICIVEYICRTFLEAKHAKCILICHDLPRVSANYCVVTKEKYFKHSWPTIRFYGCLYLASRDHHEYVHHKRFLLQDDAILVHTWAVAAAK